MMFRDAFWSWLEVKAPEILVGAMFLAGIAAGWLMRGAEHIVAWRCHTPESVSITRDGGDLIVRCAP